MTSVTKFWLIETRAELDVVERLVSRRYPILYRALSEILEATDPMDVVYPNNPNEYGDVVLEAIVIIAGSSDECRRSVRGTEEVLRRAISACFDEEPDVGRLAQAANLLSAMSLAR